MKLNIKARKEARKEAEEEKDEIETLTKQRKGELKSIEKEISKKEVFLDKKMEEVEFEKEKSGK